MHRVVSFSDTFDASRRAVTDEPPASPLHRKHSGLGEMFVCFARVAAVGRACGQGACTKRERCRRLRLCPKRSPLSNVALVSCGAFQPLSVRQVTPGQFSPGVWSNFVNHTNYVATHRAAPDFSRCAPSTSRSRDGGNLFCLIPHLYFDVIYIGATPPLCWPAPNPGRR
eukprot:gene192-biopygen214